MSGVCTAPGAGVGVCDLCGLAPVVVVLWLQSLQACTAPGTVGHLGLYRSVQHLRGGVGPDLSGLMQLLVQCGT